MHVRIAWEIYNHQQKQKSDSKTSASSSVGGTSSTSNNSKSTASNAMSHMITSTNSSTMVGGVNTSSLSSLPGGSSKSSTSSTPLDILGKPPGVGVAATSDLLNNKPSPADLLRAGQASLFPPSLPRPPTDPFGLIRPPYPGPSLFGPSHLGKK